MNRARTKIAVLAVVGILLVIAGFGFAIDIYQIEQHCEQMDASPRLSANCWTLPSQLFIAGGTVAGVVDLGMLAVSIRRYRDRDGAPQDSQVTR